MQCVKAGWGDHNLLKSQVYIDHTIALSPILAAAARIAGPGDDDGVWGDSLHALKRELGR